MTRAASVNLNRSYLALHLPYLVAERWRRDAAHDAPETLVFTHKAKNALRIAAASAEALALGLTPGLALADARARVPNLVAVPHDPMGDARAVEMLADWCDRFTPMVALDPPDGLMLDLTGCGDAATIAADAVARLRDRGLTALYALAETPDMARALARFPSPLPIAALELSEDSSTALRRAGLMTIADLAARPRASLAARFGETMTAKLARVLGEEDIRITPRRLPPALFVIRRFAEPVAHVDHMLAVLEELIAEAADEMARRGKGGRRFMARFYRSDGAVHALDIAMGAATRDPPRVIRLFRERIDALNDPLDPGFGYDAIRLAVPVLEQLGPAQLQLDGREVVDTRADLLMDQLGVRLGRDRIRRFAPGNSHIPELSGYSVPAHSPALPLGWGTNERGEPPARPLRLFDPPHRIEVMAEVPDGPPRRFRWRRAVHDVTLYEGPERIAAEWWKRRDGHKAKSRALTRDYYRVEDAKGRRFWLFRHGLYGREKDNPDWYLHGIFV